MTLHIAYSSDDNYVQHLGVSLLSLFEHNKSFESIFIHVLDNKISELNRLKLKSIVSDYNREINFYKIGDLLAELKQYNIPQTISLTAYARLFLSSILNSKIEKIIYSDCDSIYNDSLYELWQLDVSNYCIGAVEDHVGSNCKNRIGISESSKYINSGFMVMNLNKIRLNNAVEKMMDIIMKYEGNVYHHDQGVINAVFNQDIYYLHPKYNVMTSFFDFKNVDSIEHFYGSSKYYDQTLLEEAKNNPIFIHFTPAFSKRPWVKGCRHPLKGKYLYFFRKSPWQDSSLNRDNRTFKFKFLDWCFIILGSKAYRKIFS